jgi:hypothetical protein
MREDIQNKLYALRMEALRPLVNIESNAQSKASNFINQFKEKKSRNSAREVCN